jgi:polyvinyl alcohol dehydrogenase (cytochrome)
MDIRVTAAALGFGALAQTGPGPTPDPPGVYSAPAPIPPPSADGSLRPNAPFFLSPSEPIFRQRCAGCHTERGGVQMGNGVVPSRANLSAMTPESVLAALSPGGSMQSQAAFMTAADRVSMAEFVSGRKLARADTPETLTNLCKSNPALAPTAGSWNGWGPKSDNARFQPTREAGIRAADVPRLKLKWVFGVPGGGALRSQPTVSHNRVFIAGDTGRVYALDAETGCTYWSYRMETPGRLAPVVAPLGGRGGAPLAVFLVDGAGGA